MRAITSDCHCHKQHQQQLLQGCSPQESLESLLQLWCTFNDCYPADLWKTFFSKTPWEGPNAAVHFSPKSTNVSAFWARMSLLRANRGGWWWSVRPSKHWILESNFPTNWWEWKLFLLQWRKWKLWHFSLRTLSLSRVHFLLCGIFLYWCEHPSVLFGLRSSNSAYFG